MAITVRALAPLDAEALLPRDMVEQQLGLDGDDKWPLAQAHRATALAWVEKRSRVSLMRRQWMIGYDGFGTDLTIPIGPVSSVISLFYLDAGGIQQSAAGLWRLAGDRLVTAPAQRWPGGLVGTATVDLVVVAGVADAASEAAPLLTAALLLLLHLWMGGSLDEVPATITMLCDLDRTPVIA